MSGHVDVPLVSVVVRSMARPTLARALAALAQQDHPRVEIVVASACGADHPAPPPAAGPHAIRFVPAATRLSRPQAANAGHDAASGDWITFLDDDDSVLPGHISGLVAAAGRAGPARLVHTLARAVLADGSTRLFGQPMALVELHRRNFIHMSTALWSRELREGGARFDERCTTHQDWDFFLQCAQRTRFHFEPLQTFLWHADAGESGSWGGANQDDAQIAAMCALVHGKWAPQREALQAVVEPLRREAAMRAQAGDIPTAGRLVAQLLAASPNDPFGLALRAGIEQAAGDLAAALRSQALAVAARPRDPTLLHGLALIQHANGETGRARQSCARVLKLAPGHAGAVALLARLQQASHPHPITVPTRSKP
jgi:predicted TPR repeat methyltransferase